MRKAEDIVVSRNSGFYAAFPSIVSRPDGELLVAFRRAPERRRLGVSSCTHVDPNSYLVLVRSPDQGRSWSAQPELIYAHPMGGSQDPCMVQLDDGSLLVTSYFHILLPCSGVAALERAEPGKIYYDNKETYGWPSTPGGGYLMRSADNGRTWQGPIIPPQLADQLPGLCGLPSPLMNRGAMVQARDGRLYWIVYTHPKTSPGRTRLDLVVSEDRGLTWRHEGIVAVDDRVAFNETSLVETAAGELVAFVRTEGLDGRTVVVRSKDYGRTWKHWEDTGFFGYPHHGLRLKDGRVFLVYGYRQKPFGIRARVLDPECRDFAAREIVLRADGGGGDLGYPWSCLTRDGRILVVYYFNREEDGLLRHIAGTFLEDVS